MEYVTLNNGLKMPIVGFGVFRVPDKKECEESVYQAIKAGYRLIDTAASYTNEDAVGAGVKRAIEEGVCTRKDLLLLRCGYKKTMKLQRKQLMHRLKKVVWVIWIYIFYIKRWVIILVHGELWKMRIKKEN